MPISTTMALATRIGAGQRTTAVATRRHTRPRAARLDSKRPKRLPTKRTAGPSVTAAATKTSIPIATGAPIVVKYGRRAKLRQDVAPAIVRPEPKITGPTDRKVV